MRVGEVFVDTNILLYIHDKSVPEKRRVCLEWIAALVRHQLARTNLQVLNELTHLLLRKRWYSDTQTVFGIADDFAAFGATPLTNREVEHARDIHRATAYSWWDCLLLASALELGCTHFLSEDLQDGQAVEGLTIVDPFAHSPERILISP